MSDKPLDELSARRGQRKPSTRRASNGATLPSSGEDLPGWMTFFFIPKGACEACARHWHHKCWGVNVLLDPIPNCPCDCGDRKDPMRLSPQGWADLALHAPDQVWVAAMFDRQRAAGLHMCVADEEERHRAVRERN
ncbi:hypothetical protein [Streptomyces sioyaensis]|uniref:hypothetical protein n=1 Tax=Streptomyces sioyaensis TaxID=67364 RepID=UPI003789B5BE